MAESRLTMYGQVMAAELSPDTIVRAALRIVDAEGMAALTMRRLGRELDVQAMSIYHHVPNKSALLDLLVDDLLAVVEAVPARDDPIDLLESHCTRLRDTLRAHPNLASIVAGRLPASIRSVAIEDALVTAGFDREAAQWIVESFVRFALGQSIVELTGAGPLDDAVFETGLRLLLVGLRDELGR